MRIFFFLFVLVLFFSCLAIAQTPSGADNVIPVDGNGANLSINRDAKVPAGFTSSNLPIVVITTNNGQAIQDAYKIPAGLKIYNKGAGQRNVLTDIPEYSGYSGIEIRGSSSQWFPKKSYGFESWDALGNSVDVSFLGMPLESDWILNANYTDKSFLRNVMAYQVWQNLGHYATRYHFVELILNNDYKGIYIFSEKVKRDKNRLNISKIAITENTGDEVTGGYIFKIDKQTGSGGSGWNSSYLPSVSSNGQKIFFQYDYPKEGDITSQQKNYIQAYVFDFETVLKSAGFADTLNGYRKYAIENTFIDYFLMNELSKNVDGYRLSTFINKERDSKGGKIRMGPVWDFDIAWHNADYCEGDVTSGWAYEFPCYNDYWQVPFWWSRLLEDPLYRNNLACRWQNLRRNMLSNAWFDTYIDSISGQLMEAQQRNFTQWPILGSYVWPNPLPLASTYSGEVSNLKTWMHNRLSWLDANMPGNCYEANGIAENEAESRFSIYPNPVTDNLNIEFRTSQESVIGIMIINIQGSILTTIKPGAISSGKRFETLDISSYKPGIYLLRITIDGKVYTQRFIKF